MDRRDPSGKRFSPSKDFNKTYGQQFNSMLIHIICILVSPLLSLLDCASSETVTPPQQTKKSFKAAYSSKSVDAASI